MKACHQVIQQAVISEVVFGCLLKRQRGAQQSLFLLLTNAFVCSSEFLMSILLKIKQPVHTYCIANWTQQLVGKEFSNAQRTNCTKIDYLVTATQYKYTLTAIN